MNAQTPRKRHGWRGSEGVWLDAAYELLITAGVDAVKVMPLAEKLGLSRTSFYHHFSSRAALLKALIQRWDTKNTGNLVQRSEQYAETITEAVFNLFDCWIDSTLFDAPLDFAVRNWATSSPEVKATVEKSDYTRIQAITDMFRRFDYTPEQAETRALTMYYTQVGYISMMVREPQAERLERMPAYVETFTGRTTSGAEIKRFRARHDPARPEF